MNIVDALAVGIVFISVVIGCVRGVTKEILTLFSWIGALTSTFLCWPWARHVVRGWIQHPMLADGATIVVMFIMFLILFSLISYFLANIVRQSWMGGVDRALGALFGVGRGVFLLCSIEITLSTFLMRQQHPEWVKSAHCAPLIYQGADALYAVLPQRFQQSITEQRVKSHFSQDELMASSTNALVGGKEKVAQSIEAIARLNPKVMPVQEGYSKKQRQDMERFLNQGLADETEGSKESPNQSSNAPTANTSSANTSSTDTLSAGRG